MLFTQQDLGVSTNAFGILNESIYIDHNTISPNTASVIVNEDINAGIVRFSDVESISEEYGCDYIDAMIAIAESNDIDIEQLAVAVDEARIIEEPDIIYELANVVINPISENSLAYVFCEACIDSYIETDDEEYLEHIINEDTILLEKVYDPQSKTWVYTKAEQDQINRSKKANNVTTLGNIQVSATKSLGKAKIKGGSGSSWGDGGYGGGLKTPKPKKGDPDEATQWSNASAASTMREKLANRPETIRGVKKNAAMRLAQQERKSNAAHAATVASMQGEIDAAKQQSAAIGAQHDRLAGELAASNRSGSRWKKGALALGALGAVGAGLAYKRNKDKNAEISNLKGVLAQANNKPKSWISKKIASLRSIYQNYLQKAREAGPNAGTFKQIAAKILSVIDALLKKLENATA